MNRVKVLAQCLWLAGLLAACGSPNQPAATATPAAALPTEKVSGGVPQQLTDLELSIGALGETSYSGYACQLITPKGCACETPVIQKAQFTFTPDNKLVYAFEPSGGARSEWHFDHAGVNEWNLAAPLVDTSGNTQVFILALLSFKSDSYVLTQVATLSSGEVVECPDTYFHRLPD